MELPIEQSNGIAILMSSSEQPLSEKAETAQEAVKRGDIVPVPTIEQRRFSAPSSDWDPVR